MGVTGATEYYDTRPLVDQTTGGGTGVAYSTGSTRLREEKADTFTLGMVMDFHDNFTLTVDWYEIEIKDMIALEGPDSIYERCLSLEFNPTGDVNAPACILVNRDPANGSASNVDRTFSNEGRALMSGADIQLNWQRSLGAGGFSMQSVANLNLESITQDTPSSAEVDHVGLNTCSLQIQCQQYKYRIFTTFNYFTGPWNVSLRHQYWPELEPSACVTAPTTIGCYENVRPSYQLFALTGGYTFADRYRLNVGIENLLDEDPPCIGANPAGFPFATDCTHIGGSTYDPLGRRFFVSLTADF
jgi:iron complex outermembrane recepter protein